MSQKANVMVIIDTTSGYPSFVIDRVKKKIAFYQRGKEKLKVGISVNPHTRWTQHRLSQHQWNKMIVLYQSSSHKFISLAESELITYSLERFSDKCQNKIGGGGGINEPYLYDKFYLYLLLK